MTTDPSTEEPSSSVAFVVNMNNGPETDSPSFNVKLVLSVFDEHALTEIIRAISKRAVIVFRFMVVIFPS